MNYCYSYIRKSKHLTDVDELSVRFDDFEDLVPLRELLKKHCEKQRVNIIITKPEMLLQNDLFNTLFNLSELYNIAVQVYDITRVSTTGWHIPDEVIALVKDYKDKMTIYYGVIAETASTMHYLMNCGAKEIYLGGDNGFNLIKLANYLHNEDIKVRVIANYVFEEKGIDPVIQFFVRPEDEVAVIDTLELIGDRADLIDGIYEAYKDHEWYGPLKEIIFNLKTNIDNKHFYAYGWSLRYTCRRSCLFGGCQICHQLLSLGDTFKEKNIFITPKETTPLENDKKI